MNTKQLYLPIALFLIFSNSSHLFAAQTMRLSRSQFLVKSHPMYEFALSYSEGEVPRPKADRTPLEEGLRKQIMAETSERIDVIVFDWKKIKADWGRPLTENEKKKRDQHFRGVFKQWILVGPPGTGKSVACKAIAQTCGIPFFMFRASEMSNTYQNSGSENLIKIFDDVAALDQPCMLIIDELEVWFKQHANKYDSDAVLTAFWTSLDRYKDCPILVMATANDISEAPADIKSRFNSCVIRMSLPTEEQRERVLKYYMGTIFGTVDSVTAKKVARSRDKYSYRDLEILVRTVKEKEAARQANIQQAKKKRAEEAEVVRRAFPVENVAVVSQRRQEYEHVQNVHMQNEDTWFLALAPLFLAFAHGLINNILGRCVGSLVLPLRFYQAPAREWATGTLKFAALAYLTKYMLDKNNGRTVFGKINYATFLLNILNMGSTQLLAERIPLSWNGAWRALPDYRSMNDAWFFGNFQFALASLIYGPLFKAGAVGLNYIKRV